MAEVETIQLVDCISEPSRKVLKVNLSFPVPVFDFQKFDEVSIFDSRICAKMLHEVLNCHVAIEVLVKSQKCFPYFEALFCYFALNFHVKKPDSIRQDISLIFFGPILLPLHFTDVTVFI